MLKYSTYREKLVDDSYKKGKLRVTKSEKVRWYKPQKEWGFSKKEGK